MSSEISRFYLDTNTLVDVRQYLYCLDHNVPARYFPSSIKGGKAIAEALQLARTNSLLLNIRTSALTRFEMNSAYHRWAAIDVLMGVGLPIHSLRGDGNLLHHFQNHASLKKQYDDELSHSLAWFSDWEYKDVVDVLSIDAMTFIIAMPMQIISPRIQLADALHLAHAIAMGSHYLVTSDAQFSKAARSVIEAFQKEGIPPNGETFDPVIDIIDPDGFRRKATHLVTMERNRKS